MTTDQRDARTFPDITRLFAFLWAYVRPHWKLLLATFAFTALYAGASMARAYLAKGVIQVFQAAPEQIGQLQREQVVNLWDQAKVLAIFAGVIALAMGTSDYMKEWFHQSLVLRVVIAIREAVTKHVLSLSLRFFSRRRMGDLYSRLTNDVQQAHQAINFLFGDIVEDVLKIVAGVAACIYASPLLSASALIAGPAVLLPIAKYGKKIRKRSRSRQGSAAEVTESMQQMLSGIRTVKVFDREAHEMERFHRRNEELFNATLKVTRLRAFSKALLETINHGVVPLILLAGIWLVKNDYLTAPDLGFFIGALVLMYEPARRIARSYNLMQEALAGLDRIEDLLRERTDLPDAPDAKPLPTVRGDIAVRSVSFAYEGEAVLRDVTIEAKAGEIIALVGPSGGGKSTLLDLIARFYDPDSGTVEIDGHDLRKVTRASLLASLAMVTQEAFLFNDSILENIRYGRTNATMDEVIAAARAANIHDAIAALPGGYDTVVGERGATLSGGQRQRITIARALLKDPRVLLLDEATSALDSESERVVQEALERLMRGRTTFVVAHRLSTVIGATRIFVIDRGRVMEQGRHDELLGRGGLYAKLYALQSGGDVTRSAAV
jgi:ATP-binding cassette, subfamily B, bacterial MsbA